MSIHGWIESTLKAYYKYENNLREEGKNILYLEHNTHQIQPSDGQHLTCSKIWQISDFSLFWINLLCFRHMLSDHSTALNHLSSIHRFKKFSLFSLQFALNNQVIQHFSYPALFLWYFYNIISKLRFIFLFFLSLFNVLNHFTIHHTSSHFTSQLFFPIFISILNFSASSQHWPLHTIFYLAWFFRQRTWVFSFPFRFLCVCRLLKALKVCLTFSGDSTRLSIYYTSVLIELLFLRLSVFGEICNREVKDCQWRHWSQAVNALTQYLTAGDISIGCRSTADQFIMLFSSLIRQSFNWQFNCFVWECSVAFLITHD